MPRDKTGHFYFSWFPTIFAADTQHLTLAEDGAYRRLIDHYMVTRAGPLDNDAALARIVGIGLDEWMKIQAVVKSFFKPDPNRTGYLLHSVCQELIEKDAERIQFAKANGSKGGRKKALKNNEKNPTLTQQEPSTLAKQLNSKLSDKNKNSPLPPRTVDNSVERLEKNGNGSLSGGKKHLYRIQEHLDAIDVSYIKSQCEGWDIYHLAGIFNESVNSGRLQIPRKPAKAFEAWVKSYTKGKPPD